MEAHVYVIQLPDGRKYIGSTIESIERRFQRHMSRARVGERPNSRLHNAMRSVGLVGLKLELLRTVPIAERMNTEAHFIRTLKTTYVGSTLKSPGGKARSEAPPKGLISDGLRKNFNNRDLTPIH